MFLLHDVHAAGPITFQSRWAMSYLRGPLSREQIRALTAADKQSTPASPDPSQVPPSPSSAPRAPAAKAAAPSSSAPVLAPNVQQYYLPSAAPNPHYTPVVLGIARVTFTDAKLKINETRDIVAVAPIGSGAVPVDWPEAEVLDVDPSALDASPAGDATFDPVPKPATVAKNYAVWQKSFVVWLSGSQTLDLHRHSDLKLTSKAGESERDFRIRAGDAQRQARDAEVDAVRRKFAVKRAKLEEKLRRADQGVAREQEQASAAKVQTAVSMGATVLGALLGRKMFSATNLGRATTAARGVGRASKEQDDVARAQQNVDAARKELEELDAEIASETATIAASFDAAASAIDTVSRRPQARSSARAVGGTWVEVGWRVSCRLPAFSFRPASSFQASSSRLPASASGSPEATPA